MTNHRDLPPLDSALAALVADARSSSRGPSGAQRTRLRARLAASLVVPAVGAAGWSTAAAAPAAAKAVAAGALGKSALALVAIAIGTGAVVGIRQITSSDGAPVDDAPAHVSQAPAPSPVPAWADERRLLQEARVALAQKRGPQALERIEEHGRRFAAGLLAEERDALRVQALVGVGRLPEARAAAARFETGYPASLHRGAVRRALQTP